MNFNAIIAVLVIKQIITREEGEQLVEHLHDKPQSTELRDAITAVGEIIGAPVVTQAAPLTGGPAQQAEELAARSAQPTPQVAPASNQVAADNAANTANITGQPEADLGDNATPTAEPAPTTDNADDKPADNTADKPSDSDTSDKSEDDKNTSNKKSSKK